jgi:ABC-type antimicrobial peptide transport system ATPase subunit
MSLLPGDNPVAVNKILLLETNLESISQWCNFIFYTTKPNSAQKKELAKPSPPFLTPLVCVLQTHLCYKLPFLKLYPV